MKQGRSLTELAQEIERQQKEKKDFIADTRQMTVSGDGKNLAIQGINQFLLSQIAHDQICNTLSLPRKYYQLMQAEAPELLALNVNHWFGAKPQKRMIRTLDGKARAILSNRYRAMDNFDLANAFLPILAEQELQIKSCELTEKKMYIKAVFPQIQREVKKGDIVESGLLITNSEVGFGSLVIQPLVHRLVCLNGMIVNDAKLSRRHLGKAHNGDDDAYEVFADDTRAADDKALWLKVRDVVKSTLSENSFDKYVRKFVESTEVKVDGDPIEAVQCLSDNVGLLESEKSNVIRHLIEGGDLSSWGMANAVTRAAQDCESYDRSTELEVIGGKVIDLGADAWKAA